MSETKRQSKSKSEKWMGGGKRFMGNTIRSTASHNRRMTEKYGEGKGPVENIEETVIIEDPLSRNPEALKNFEFRKRFEVCDEKRSELETLLKTCNDYTEKVTRQSKDRIDRYIIEHDEKLSQLEEKLRVETKINRRLQEENNELAMEIAAIKEQSVPKSAFNKEIENCKTYVAKAEKYRDELKAEIARLTALAGSSGTSSKSWSSPFSFPTTSTTSSPRIRRGPELPPKFSRGTESSPRTSRTSQSPESGEKVISRPVFPGSHKRSRTSLGAETSRAPVSFKSRIYETKSYD